jgi:hypothetical protein
MVVFLEFSVEVAIPSIPNSLISEGLDCRSKDKGISIHPLKTEIVALVKPCRM